MTRRTATTAAIILSLAAAGAPAASARPAGYVPTGHVPASNQTPATVYSRPDRTMIPVSPPTTGGGVTDGTSALRFLTPQERQRVAGISALGDPQLAASSDVATSAANPASAPQALVRVHAQPGGFDWGDAGIGAAGLALSVIGIGGAVAVSQRRSRRTTALPS